jgi:pyridinium-3,5-biscarboxylic acid mononucleotide synthase
MTDLVDERTLAELLHDVARGRLSVENAVEELRDLPYQQLEDAKIDHHRELRTGVAEAVFAPGKTVGQVLEAATALAERSRGAVLITRASRAQADAVLDRHPDAVFHERSGLVVVRSAEDPPARTEDDPGVVCVVTAGTSDLPVAEEAARTAEALGLRVLELVDVGVAGVHRILEHRAVLEDAGCLVVVAGMEGALASVVAGLTSRPVVAVPTSVGYGASFEGLAALLGMLSSCAPGIAVVNIDNGFGAAQVAYRIATAGRRLASRDAATGLGRPSAAVEA